jgi:hypothetical protein
MSSRWRFTGLTLEGKSLIFCICAFGAVACDPVWIPAEDLLLSRQLLGAGYSRVCQGSIGDWGGCQGSNLAGPFIEQAVQRVNSKKGPQQRPLFSVAP